MKNITIEKLLVVLLLLAVVAGCKKDDDKVLNKVTIDGNSNPALNTYYVPSTALYFTPVDAQCTATLYMSEIRLYFTSEAAIYIMFYRESDTEDVPIGTFPLASDCAEGFDAYFFSAPGRKPAGLYFSGGTVKVSNIGNTFDVDLNLTISSESGNGTLKGNFSGQLYLGQAK